MELKNILEQQAEYVRLSGFTVKTDSAYCTVAMDNEKTGEGWFLQGEEAEAFIDEAEALWNNPESQVGMDICEQSIAKQYIDCM